MNKKHKTIRALENKASKNDLNAIFQLAQYYEHGQFVEKNAQQAEGYFNLAFDLFIKQSLKLSSLKLINFRHFEKSEIDFSNKNNSNLTVFVGNNGSGKTTLLEVIEKTLDWLILAIKSKTNSGKAELIDQSEINNNELVEYASIISQFTVFEKTNYKIELSNAKKGSKTKRKSYLKELRQLADIYKLANSKNIKFNFPIMASYSVERAIDITKKDTKPFDEISGQTGWNKFDGYKDALNGKADFKLFFRWFKYFQDVQNASDKQYQNILTSIDKLQAELDSELVVEMEKKAELEGKENEFLTSFKQDKKEQIKTLENEMTNSDISQSSQVTNHVTKAIYKSMPDFKKLRIQYNPLDMLIDKKEITLSVLQLSQGEKSLLALVGDIARRLVLLNPSLDDPLKGNGIVLIDEIDLHLHPKWQQTIIPNLLNTFPNVQFIITTHSPLVLTTVHHTCIRILKDGKIINTDIGTLGEESRTTLEDIMHVDSRPDDKMSQQLQEYLKRINRGDIYSEEVSSLRVQLEKHYGQNYSQLKLADMAINRWKAIEKKKTADK